MDAKHLQNCREVVAIARQGDIGSARFQQQLLANRTRTFHSWKPEVAGWKWAEGEVFLAGGDASAARDSFHKALEILSSKSYQDSYGSLIAEIYRSLARASMKVQQWGDAAESFSEAVRWGKTISGEESWQDVWALYPAWAGAMFLSGDGNAKGTLDEGLRSCQAIWGSGSKEWQSYLQRSAAMLREVGQTAEAERYRHILEETPDDIDEVGAVLADVQKLVGLQNVKQHLQNLADISKLSRLRQEQGLPPVPLSTHLALLGPPGTGKSTVAMLAARLYKALGLLPTANIVTATGGELSGSRTTKKVQDLCDRSQGGVLLMQEAYSIPNAQRAEAVATMLDRMEEERDRFALIVTGYTEPMEEFLQSNPGLQSRFETVLRFPPYIQEELLQIFESIAGEYDITLDEQARKKVLLADGQAGARSMRNLFQASLARQAARITAAPDESDLSVFLEEDIAIDDAG